MALAFQWASILLATFSCAHGAFNTWPNINSTWSSNSVQPNAAGTFCYFPAANQTNATVCSGGHSQDSNYQAVMNIHRHLAQGWSIAYYSIDNTLLGGKDYPVPTNVSTVECLSGQAGDAYGGYQTMCMTTEYDNNIAEAGSYCQVAVAQYYVSDGCYTAMPNTTSTSTPTSTTATPTTKSPNAASSESTLIVSIVVPIGVAILTLVGGWIKREDLGRLWQKMRGSSRYTPVEDWS